MKKIILLLLFSTQCFTAIPRYSMFEIDDINNRQYENPYDFEEIEYRVTFISPRGQKYEVLGFFDGASEGNQVWRARIAPNELGIWKYKARFSDGASAGEAEFEVVSSMLHGPVLRDPHHPYKFMHHDGTPIFILGNTIYNILGAPESEWEVVLRNQLKLCAEVGFNKVRFAPYSEHQYKNNPIGWNAHPWYIQSDGKIDYTRYNLDHWRKIEEMVQRFGLQSVICDFIFVMHELRVDDGLGDAFSKQRKQYYKYAASRLHGFWNIAWDLENEANEVYTKGNRRIWHNYDMKWYNTFGELVASLDPYLQHEPPGFGRMLAVHDNNTPPDFSWSNHSKLQWKTTVPQGLLFRIDPLVNLSYRGQEYNINLTRNGKPVFYEEYGYEGEQILEYIIPDEVELSQEIKTDNLIQQKQKSVPGLPHAKGNKGDRQRRAVWTITTAGAYATYGDKTSLFDEKGHQIDPGRYGRPYISGDIRGSTEIGTRYLAVLKRFIEDVVTAHRFQKMLPHHEFIVNAQNIDDDRTVWKQHTWFNYPDPPDAPYFMAFCLADPGNAYLLYLPYGGWVDLNLPKNNITYAVIWLNPRNGEILDGNPTSFQSNDLVRFEPPNIQINENDPGDWVLFIEKVF